MSQVVVVFHSVLGLRPAIHDFAQYLRLNGHTVYTPDSFDGETFSSIDEGARKRDLIGIPELISRARAAVSRLPNDVVYAGFSLGAIPAELLAGTRQGARAAILMHGAIPLQMMGVAQWPAVPVQIHYSTNDPWVEAQEVESFSNSVRASKQTCEIFPYPGKGHLFDDEGSSDYDAAASITMRERVAQFLKDL
jgi:dienelactone hydrolase